MRKKGITNNQLFDLLSRIEVRLNAIEEQYKGSIKKKHYNYEEAAQILCITKEALKTRVKRGQLIRVSNSGTPLIAQAEIDRFLKTQNP